MVFFLWDSEVDRAVWSVTIQRFTAAARQCVACRHCSNHGVRLVELVLGTSGDVAKPLTVPSSQMDTTASDAHTTHRAVHACGPSAHLLSSRASRPVSP